MSQQVTISIVEDDVLVRFQQATFKQGRALEQPQLMKQVYNLQADKGEIADDGLMHESYIYWLGEAINLVREYLTAEPYVGAKPFDRTTFIPLLMPGNWEHYAPDAPGLKYAMLELIQDGMLADWYDNTKPDSAKTFRQKAELNKAEIRNIVYSLKPPTVSITSVAGQFEGEGGQD